MPAETLTPRFPPPPVPRSVLALGYGGLLPFVAGAIAVWAVGADARYDVALALAAYAATIVSFLGGIHWGLAFRHAAPPPRLLWWGVLPSLVAWLALLLHPALGLVVLGSMLLLCLLVDRRVYRSEGVAQWLPLRLQLSVVAALACFVGAAGS